MPQDSSSGANGPSPREVADYVHELTLELAVMAEGAGLGKLASALMLARDLARETRGDIDSAA